MKVLVCGILLTIFVVSINGTCVWYGQCYFDEIRNHWKNCDYTGEAKTIKDWGEEPRRILNYRCPDLYPDVSADINTCCSIDQVYEIDTNIKLAEGIIRRCPTCLRNMIRHICEFTCGPNQNKFAETLVVQHNDTVRYVDELTLNVNKTYMENAYGSCSEVGVPQSGSLAMDMMCGPYSAKECTPQRWFDAMGSIATSFVPFQINYIESEDENALNPRTVYCNEIDEISNDNLTCSCVDCSASCTFELEIPGLNEVCSGIHCVAAIIAICLLVSLSGVFLGISLGSFLINRRSNLKPNLDNSTPKKSKFVFHGFNNFMENIFYKLGIVIASQPTFVIMLVSWLIIGLSIGLLFIEFTTNPVELWSSPTSTVRKEKDFFDSRFGPFYRTEQIFFQAVGYQNVNDPENPELTYGPAFNKTFLEHIINVQMDIMEIGVEENAGLDKICFAPLRSPFTGPETIEQCTIMSFYGYFQYDLDNFNSSNYLRTILNCIGNSYDPTCLAPWGGGVEPELAFGGVNATNIRNADTVILTFVVKNHLNKEDLKPALAWEKKFIDYMKKYEENVPDGIDVSYSSERSVEDEIERVSQGEVVTVVVSYLAMLIYTAISLGNIRSCKTLMLDSKISLALVGIVIVISSVTSSLGFFAYIGISTTLLTMQVLPFLVLAIGVDNIFILVAAYNDVCCGLQDGSFEIDFDDKKNKKKRKQFIFGKTVGKVGPSMVLTTASQCTCFAIGSLSGMPAVSSFAQYAAMAIFFDFLFQVTAFVAFLSLDNERFENGRLDIFCCATQKQLCNSGNDKMYTKGLMNKVFQHFYIPLILNKFVKPIIAIGFMAWITLSIYVIPHIDIGLDQEVAMPWNSFVRKYLLSVGSLLQVGPPIYWVVTQGLNYHEVGHQNHICGGVMCDDNSLLTILHSASQASERTYLTRNPNSWVDDYFIWATSEDCCQYFISNNSFCPHQVKNGCAKCEIETDSLNLRPSSKDFQKYLSYFLMDNPDAECPNAGHPSYGPGLNYLYDNSSNAQVRESYFMGYHRTLRGSRDFYESYRYTKDMGANLTKMLREKTGNKEIQVFPYSIHYVFYEQYLTMWEDTFKALGYSLLVIFGVSFIFTGLDLFSSMIILIVVTMILINIMGFMYWWDISMNAVSLVNLVMGIGIAVEFCSHIVLSFAKSIDEPKNRVRQAMIEMGSNVLIGITLTNFPAIIVLAFSQSELFEIYYFRMFLLIVLVGAAHGLIFLPVFLHYLMELKLILSRLF